MNLNRTQMLEVQEAVTDAFDHVMAQFIGESATRVRSFLLQFTCSTSFYMAFSPNEFKQLMDTIFTQSDVRDFVMRVTAAFHARFGDGHAQYNSLLETLTWAYNQKDPEPSLRGYMAIPEAIASRMPSREDVANLLKANKWLVTMALIHLYLRVDMSTPAAPKRPMALPG